MTFEHLNNYVKLTGNIGHEIEVLEKDDAQFTFFSLATQDYYKDTEGDYLPLETNWHKIAVFSPQVLARVKDLKKGTRVAVTGMLVYEPFKVLLEDGREVTKYATSVKAIHIEQAPLVAKKK